ncbi:hypothetical protein C7212DRAFT_345894 [Tuber magnatum]|uniref:Uncharacterized protein n=1 Tax=Tuber magnatum TaxID=42249 RepID=A0A317SJA3_9PEZI|nr:hypothetical protein C7212DRAFT_345894 [Tuber magnatum]
MRSATLCALCAASSVCARAVWGDDYSLAGRAENTDTIADAIYSATHSATDITSEGFELAVERIENTIDDIEMAADEIDTLLAIDIEPSAGVTAAVDPVEDVLGSASTAVSIDNATAGPTSGTDPIASETIIVTSTDEPTGVNVRIVDDIEAVNANDPRNAADAIYAASRAAAAPGGAPANAIGAAGNLTMVVEGAGAATNDSGMAVSANEGTDVIMADDLEIALPNDPDTVTIGRAITTPPTIASDGTNLTTIFKIPLKVTVTTGGVTAPNSTISVGGPSGTNVTAIAPDASRADATTGGGTAVYGTAIVSGPTGIDVTAIPGAETGGAEGGGGAGARGSVVGIGSIKIESTGGVDGTGTRGSITSTGGSGVGDAGTSGSIIGTGVAGSGGGVSRTGSTGTEGIRTGSSGTCDTGSTGARDGATHPGGIRTGGTGADGIGGAGTRGSVTGAGGAETRGTRAGGSGGAGTRSCVTGAGGSETRGTRVGGAGIAGTRGARMGGARSRGARRGGARSRGARAGGARAGGARAGGARTGSSGGTGTGGGATTITTITRTSNAALPTVTTAGFGRFGSGLTGGIPGYCPDRSIFCRCMNSAGACFRAARRGTIPYAQCEAIKASCRMAERR